MKVAVISLKVGESNRAMMISTAEELLSVVTILTDVCLVHMQTILLNQKLVLLESLPDKQYPLCTHITLMPNPTKMEGNTEGGRRVQILLV